MRRFKLPKLNHPWAKSAAGFTLVELIVVIAIMGILAGVGTVGYSGYAKSANKKADMVLVGNIIRAIETGTYSTMYVNDDSFKMGNIAYPVGFVTLSPTGMQVVTSKTKMTPNEVKDAGACVFETIEGVLVKNPQTWNSGCSQNTTATYFTITEGTLTYCKTHSTVAPSVTPSDGEEYVAGYNHKKGSNLLGCTFSCGTPEPIPGYYPSGKNIVNNQDSLELKKTDTLCEIAYVYQYDTYDGNTTNIAARTSGPLYESLTAAFGDVSNLKLTYNGWVNDEGVNYATFYTAAPSMMGDLKGLSGLLALGSQYAKDSLGISKEYADGEDVLAGVSQNFNSTFSGETGEEKWLAVWNRAATEPWDSVGFDLTGRENYSAARTGYNNGVASYLAAKGVPSTYTDIIKGLNAKEIPIPLVGTIGLPGLANTSAFADNGPLKEKFKSAGDSDGSMLHKCAEYFEEYKNSEAYQENGKAFYEVMTTFGATSDIARDDTNAFGGDMYKYYNSYVNEIAGLYGKAQEASSGGIVIIVTVDDGDMKCVVSPSAADPRNK